MEKECFVQTMDSLLSEIKVKEVDAHPQISALLSKFATFCGMLHYSIILYY